MTISAKPIVTPSPCGMVRAKPNFALDAMSIRLFGPGVKNPGIAAATNAAKVVVSTTPTLTLSQCCCPTIRQGALRQLFADPALHGHDPLVARLDLLLEGGIGLGLAHQHVADLVLQLRIVRRRVRKQQHV